MRSPTASSEDAGGAAGPELFGPWRVLEVLGEGASGRVLLACRGDGGDGRRVAIKTLHSPSRAALARFELERQVLARLEHPNIARLYDAGQSSAGVPYVVLEHVDGLPIDEYCEEQGLGVEERLRLFLEVCRGVQHAHRNLIVHRDLKPANILVGADGRPRLLDFGIARLLGSPPPAAPATAAEGSPEAPTELAPAAFGAATTLLADAVARTPAYASPEQILGQPITTASDVFSLGIVLYELLAGRSPWAGKTSRHELERAICEQDAEPPSRAARRGKHPWRSRRLAGALDAIVQKALARAPADRYASVEALARDLENHLEHRPILARPPSVFTTGRLFLRRHLGATVAAALLLAAIGIFLGVLAGQARLLRAERDKAERTLAFLVQVFRAGEPGQAGAAERADQLTARQILDRAAERVQQEMVDQPESQATLLGAIGEVYNSLGHYEEAVRLQELTLELRRALYGDDNLDTAATRSQLADALVMGRGGAQRAEEQYRLALAVRREQLEEDAPALVDNLIGLATALEIQRKFEEVIVYRQEVADLTPDVEAGRRLLVLGTLAGAQALAGHFEEAAKVDDEAFALALRSADQSTVDFADGLFEVGVGLSRSSDPRSRPIFERSLAIRRKLLPADHPRLLESEQSVASGLMAEERFAEALPILEQVVEAKVRKLGEVHFLTVTGQVNLAICLGELGDWDRAAALIGGALARAEAAGKGPGDLAFILRNLAGAERRRGHLDAAWKYQLQAEKAMLESGAPRPALVELMLARAALEADLGQAEVALGRFELLIGEMRRRWPEGNWRIDFAESEQARALALAGRPAEALPLALRAYDRLRDRFGSRAVRSRGALRALLAVYQANGDRAAAARVEGWLADPDSRPARLEPPESAAPL